MEELKVNLGERSYPIYIGNGLLDRVAGFIQEAGISSKEKIFIVTDGNIAPLYLDHLEKQLKQQGFQTAHYIVEPGEQAKDLEIYNRIITEALEFGLDRQSVFIALGGGVVGDLTGFVAATYMRGVPFIQVPTTLLAHDSSVGGKVAVNHPLGKNIIGAFHQPLMVIYDTDTLVSLPKREIAAGFAEVVKHGLIWDASFVEWLDEHSAALNALEPDVLPEAISRACAVKVAVVSEDEKEKGLRAILNLGHTFGHAIEALSSYKLVIHGEAVSMGMATAARLAEKMGIADNVLQKTKALLEKYDLPTVCPSNLDEEKMIEVMRRDKKGSKGELVMVLPREIGRVEVVHGVDERLVKDVLHESKERRSQ